MAASFIIITELVILGSYNRSQEANVNQENRDSNVWFKITNYK